MADSTALIESFKTLRIPRIYVKNNVTDSVYVLSCYEDVPYNVEDINNNLFTDG